MRLKIAARSFGIETIGWCEEGRCSTRSADAASASCAARGRTTSLSATIYVVGCARSGLVDGARALDIDCNPMGEIVTGTVGGDVCAGTLHTLSGLQGRHQTRGSSVSVKPRDPTS
jgi:hypothetical protein